MTSSLHHPLQTEGFFYVCLGERVCAPIFHFNFDKSSTNLRTLQLKVVSAPSYWRTARQSACFSSRGSGLRTSCNWCTVTGPSFRPGGFWWRRAWWNELAPGVRSGTSKAVVGSGVWMSGWKEELLIWNWHIDVTLLLLLLLHLSLMFFPLSHWFFFQLRPTSHFLLLPYSLSILHARSFCPCCLPSSRPYFPCLCLSKSLTLCLWGSTRSGIESLSAESLFSFMSLRDCLL